MTSEIVWESDDPLLRASGETRRANAALRDYCLMGEGRSVRRLHARYREQGGGDSQAKKPPTLYLNTLFGWSSRYDWVARSIRFDQLEQERELREWRDRRREDREIRIKMLESLRAKMIKGLQYAEPQTLDWHELIAGVRMVTTELRHEFGEVDQVVEVRPGVARPPSPVASLSDEELEVVLQNLLVGEGILELEVE